MLPAGSSLHLWPGCLVRIYLISPDGPSQLKQQKKPENLGKKPLKKEFFLLFHCSLPWTPGPACCVSPEQRYTLEMQTQSAFTELYFAFHS